MSGYEFRLRLDIENRVHQRLFREGAYNIDEIYDDVNRRRGLASDSPLMIWDNIANCFVHFVRNRP